MKTIGDRIAEIINDMPDMTLEKFGSAVGVSKSAVSKWINGATKDLRNEHLFKIEDRFGVSARWLVTGEGQQNVNIRQYGPRTRAIADLVEDLDDSGKQAVQDSAEKEKQLQEFRAMRPTGSDQGR